MRFGATPSVAFCVRCPFLASCNYWYESFPTGRYSHCTLLVQPCYLVGCLSPSPRHPWALIPGLLRFAPPLSICSLSLAPLCGLKLVVCITLSLRFYLQSPSLVVRCDSLLHSCCQLCASPESTFNFLAHIFALSACPSLAQAPFSCVWSSVSCPSYYNSCPTPLLVSSIDYSSLRSPRYSLALASNFALCYQCDLSLLVYRGVVYRIYSLLASTVDQVLRTLK